MHDYLDRAKTNSNRVTENTVTQQKKSVKQSVGFEDNHHQAAAQMKLQEIADNSSRTKQLLQMKEQPDSDSMSQLKVIQQGGSHGKKKKLNVQGTYTDGGAATAFNDRDENISIVKGHGGYSDQGALAEAWVKKAYRLSGTAVVTITKYNFFTAK